MRRVSVVDFKVKTFFLCDFFIHFFSSNKVMTVQRAQLCVLKHTLRVSVSPDVLFREHFHVLTAHCTSRDMGGWT